MRLQSMLLVAVLLTATATPMVAAQDQGPIQVPGNGGLPCDFVLIYTNQTPPVKFSESCFWAWVFYIEDIVT